MVISATVDSDAARNAGTAKEIKVFFLVGVIINCCAFRLCVILPTGPGYPFPTIENQFQKFDSIEELKEKSKYMIIQVFYILIGLVIVAVSNPLIPPHVTHERKNLNEIELKKNSTTTFLFLKPLLMLLCCLIFVFLKLKHFYFPSALHSGILDSLLSGCVLRNMFFFFPFHTHTHFFFHRSREMLRRARPREENEEREREGKTDLGQINTTFNKCEE